MVVARVLHAQDRLQHSPGLSVWCDGADPVVLFLPTGRPCLSHDAKRALSEAHRGIATEFAGVYRQGVESGVFRSIPPRLVGRMMDQIIMAGGKVVMESKDPTGEVDEIAGETATLLVAALRARPEPS